MSKQELAERVILAVASKWKVNPLDIIGQHNSRPVSEARQVCALLLRDSLTASEIGSLLGKRSYSYAGQATKTITRKAKGDHELFLRVLKLTEKFDARWLCST